MSEDQTPETPDEPDTPQPEATEEPAAEEKGAATRRVLSRAAAITGPLSLLLMIRVGMAAGAGSTSGDAAVLAAERAGLAGELAVLLALLAMTFGILGFLRARRAGDSASVKAAAVGLLCSALTILGWVLCCPTLHQPAPPI